MALDSDSKKTLRQKVEDADFALSLKRRAENDALWAEAHVQLSEALLALADAEEHKDDALTYYSEAASGFEKALQVFRRKNNFQRWGGIVISYVRCLRNYALREEGEIAVLRLKRGLVLLDKVYKALPAKEGDFDRALILTEKGHVYRALADTDLLREREERLLRAMQAFDAAIAILRKKENFHYWSLAVSASALTAAELARVEPLDQARTTLELAVERFETALVFFNDNDHPQDLTYIHFEMARTLMQLATLDTANSAGLMERALIAFEKARDALGEEDGNHTLIRLQSETALALSLLAQQKKGKAAALLLEKSVVLYQSNIELLQGQSETVAIALAYGNLGKDLTQLANLASSRTEELQKRYQAIAALRKAIGREIKHVRPFEWLSYFIELGVALQAAANLEEPEKSGELLREAVKFYNEGLETIDKRQNQKLINKIMQWRALAYAHLGKEERSHQGAIWLKQAELDFRMTITKLDPKTDKLELFRLYTNLAHVLYAIARRKDSDTPVDLLKAAAGAIETAFTFAADNGLDNKDEQLDAYAHHALILWRMGSFGGILDAFQKSQTIYEMLLETPVIRNRYVVSCKIKNSYVFMLKDWAEKVDPEQARLLLEKGVDLAQELRDLALAENDDKAQKKYDDVIIKLKSQINTLAKKRFLNFWPLKRK
ncbi:hypothetical protein [uncultured Bartonella sp.]|uniref:hypothetical protein n=1 Tax=uncultured Bartonella sp. TaxID=104108 RepID=UPI002631F598|nr:hypothetical protein [uncultured Bartonella sp.]